MDVAPSPPRTPLDAYMQGRPPRHVLLHPPAPVGGSAAPIAVTLAVLGGRNFPPPAEGEPAAAQGRRRTGEGRAKSSSLAATHGVYVVVGCGAWQACSRMVVGGAVCQPQFGDEWRVGVEGEEAVEMEVRWGRIGGVPGEAGVTLGTAHLPLQGVQAALGGGRGEMWHSVIDGRGLVVGELHVRWAMEGTEGGEPVVGGAEGSGGGGEGGEDVPAVLRGECERGAGGEAG